MMSCAKGIVDSFIFVESERGENEEDDSLLKHDGMRAPHMQIESRAGVFRRKFSSNKVNKSLHHLSAVNPIYCTYTT